MNSENMLKDLENIFEGEGKIDEKLLKVCKYLREHVEHYDWVGFYFVDRNKKDELVLGPFDGEPTEHVRIKFGQGICGQAAQKKDVFIVQDVAKETNYLSCSPKVKSEIVVPIIKDGKIIGEIDIDSHKLSPFKEEDRIFLEKVANLVSRYLD